MICHKCGYKTERKISKGGKSYIFCLKCSNKRILEWRHRKAAMEKLRISETWCIKHQVPYTLTGPYDGKYQYRCNPCKNRQKGKGKPAKKYCRYHEGIKWMTSGALIPIHNWISTASENQRIIIKSWQRR